MNIEKLLNYQKTDEQLYTVEQKLSNSAYRKKANELAGIAKKSQARFLELEAEAERLVKEIDEITAKYNQNKAKADEMLQTAVDGASLEDVEKLSALKNKVQSNLALLEKLLQKSAESINRTLSEFNKTKKLFDQARVQFEACKKKIAEEAAALEPEKKRLEAELAKLEKEVDAQAMAEYKKKRQDNIFPVVVPLENGAFCGRCRMEQPKVAISRLKENGVITCEHCKRFIYAPKD